jgi:hypothetical protein
MKVQVLDSLAIVPFVVWNVDTKIEMRLDIHHNVSRSQLHCRVQVSAQVIHSFSSLSYDRSKASSKASSPHSAIQSFFLQMSVSSPFLKVIQ